MTTGRSRFFSRLLLAAAGLVVVGFLFMRSLEQTRTEPYAVPRDHADAWTLEVAPAGSARSPMLVMRTSRQLVSNLSRQVFQRTMESTASPMNSLIPVVMQGEFDAALAGRMTADDLLAAARAAGLETARHQLRCLAHRRESSGRSVQQVYFLIVDSPGIMTFREELARSAGATFDASALTPVVIVAHSEGSFDRWLPIRASEAECVAPIRVEG